MCREIIIFFIYFKKMKRNQTKQFIGKKPNQTSLSTDYIL